MTITEGPVTTSAGWVPDDRQFGARLALVRQRMHWGNVKEAALACGIAPESWRQWERDNVRPQDPVKIAEAISRRTGCDFGWLVEPRLTRQATQQYLSQGTSVGPTRRQAADPQPTSHPAFRRSVRLPSSLVA